MNQPLRPFELVRRQFEEERRKVLGSEEKRRVVLERIKAQLELRRLEDRIIVSNESFETRLIYIRRIHELNREIERLG